MPIRKMFQDIRKIFSLTNKDQISRTKFKLKDLAFFFQFVKPVWKVGLASFVLVMIMSGISSLLPLSSKIFIDFVITKTGYSSINMVLNALGLGKYAPAMIGYLGSAYVVLAIMAIVIVMYTVVNILQSYFSSVYQQELIFNLQTSLYDRVLRYPMTFMKSSQTGYLMSRVSDDVSMMQYLFSTAITQILSYVFYIIFSFSILFAMNMNVAAFMVVLIPVYVVIRHLFSNRIRSLSYMEREYNSEVSKEMQETLSGIELVKSYATERKEAGKLVHKLREVIQARIIRTLIISLAGSSISLVMFTVLLIIMFIGANEIQKGAMTLGDFVSIITYVGSLSGTVNSLYGIYMSFQPAFASMDRLKEMFLITPEFEWEENNKHLKKLDYVKGELCFEHVSFAYNINEPVIKNISFTIRPGGSLALVGHSGVGKTTIASLMLKFYIPQSGTIYLDGVNINDLDHSWLRQQISIVSQDVFLFNDTIENNIKYGRPDASYEDVKNVAKKAHIDEFIEKLPNGYNTMIGERGTKLSGGQRQRLSIARSFLKNAPILILDEPTSAIDSETEFYVKDSLAELMKFRTTIIISHRMSLINIADRIIVMDDGKIVQDGSHTELESKEGIYHTLKTLN